MKFEATKIILTEKANPPKIEVHISFGKENQFCNQGGSINIYHASAGLHNLLN